METAQHRPEAACRKTGTQRHILGKAGVKGGGERAPVAAAPAPRRPAQRPLGRDMDDFGLEIVDQPRQPFVGHQREPYFGVTGTGGGAEQFRSYGLDFVPPSSD